MVEKRGSFGRITKRLRKRPESPIELAGKAIQKRRIQVVLDPATSMEEKLEAISRANAELNALAVDWYDQTTAPDQRPHLIEELEARTEEQKMRFQKSGKEGDRETYTATERLTQALRNKWFPPAQQ